MTRGRRARTIGVTMVWRRLGLIASFYFLFFSARLAPSEDALQRCDCGLLLVALPGFAGLLSASFCPLANSPSFHRSFPVNKFPRNRYCLCIYYFLVFLGRVCRRGRYNGRWSAGRSSQPWVVPSCLPSLCVLSLALTHHGSAIDVASAEALPQHKGRRAA